MDRLRHLHAEHAVAVRAYALRRADATTADDSCAEVWAIAWRRIDSVPPDALPWLLATTRRVLANERRAQRRRVALLDRLTASAPTYTPAPVPSGDSPLAAALATLRPGDRETLLLVAWEELSTVRAAAVLGVSPRTFAVRLHRARKRLAAALDTHQASTGRVPTHSERIKEQVP